MKQNYQIMLEKTIKARCSEGTRPSLLLHACCAPCSSYVLEYLDKHFDITLYFYNPNISSESEYNLRANELKRLIGEMPLTNEVKLIVPAYDPSEFKQIALGKESEPERGSRCTECYYIRLKKTYEEAAEAGFDFFSTTLSISPHKDAERINTIGKSLAKSGSVEWLYSDFKKKNGYKRSIELSAKYGLYRQNFCGCSFSKRT